MSDPTDYPITPEQAREWLELDWVQLTPSAWRKLAWAFLLADKALHDEQQDSRTTHGERDDLESSLRVEIECRQLADKAREQAERERDEAVTRLGEDGTPAMIWRERARDAERKVAAGVVVPRNTVSYAATALEGSADNGDQYCASQLRAALGGDHE